MPLRWVEILNSRVFTWGGWDGRGLPIGMDGSGVLNLNVVQLSRMGWVLPALEFGALFVKLFQLGWMGFVVSLKFKTLAPGFDGYFLPVAWTGSLDFKTLHMGLHWIGAACL